MLWEENIVILLDYFPLIVVYLHVYVYNMYNATYKTQTNTCDTMESCIIHTGCSLNIVFFPSNVVIFLNSASSAAALVFYLPGVCTHTDTEGKQSSEYF